MSATSMSPGLTACVRRIALAALGALLVASGPCAAAGAATAAPKDAAQALHALMDAEFESDLAQFPERATMLGDHRYDDRLTDRSPAAIAARREHHRRYLAAHPQ